MAKFIKVRNLEGNFSTGGMYVRFTKKGKTWSSLGYLKRHFAQFKYDELRRIYINCTIIILDEETLEKSELWMKDFISDYIVDAVIKREKNDISNLKARKKLYENEIIKLELKLEVINRDLDEKNKNN